MSDESQSLRKGIRDGFISCRCPRQALTDVEDYHLIDCQWNAAIRRIYEIERVEDAQS